jgi:hypothetical protein
MAAPSDVRVPSGRQIALLDVLSTTLPQRRNASWDRNFVATRQILDGGTVPPGEPALR